MSSGKIVRRVVAALLAAGLLSSCGFRRKYENPITADTQQPDKILFDKAIGDIEKGRFDVARITLQTLISTYDTSEFLAKAKLAIADSWFREGGASGLAQAEAEYKEFILFYPTLEEAPEAQQKVCEIHYRQMEKPDRDTDHALRADEECRQVLVQFPNSKFAPQVMQRLRNIQEVLANHEYGIGAFYFNKGSFPAAAARLQGLTEQYPLYSRADEALWKLGDAYSRMPARFADRAAEAYARIVKEYPLSGYVQEATAKLQAMDREVPEADPVALARMKYELANQDKPGLMSHFWGLFRKSPSVAMAAKSGAPAMAALRPTIPVSVPAATSGEAPTADVTAAPIVGSSELDTAPDARQSPPSGAS
ncbi:MAG TPA: outer membrane protein assembly factor BamD, partial [Bryobacteraceae bacterium]|nr:outer membrane protein assembly factor BamD [Bryobacteraceae bacterium]